ncbi:unnamed protein product [Tuber aestivum]|uniref:Uncharacterized protein n=1 Tax=Tuber aestivum TaxID=59557 RepID=A0A292Q280_9PEZI|nr:unnamed protein product [Tuber aestivum]
MRSSSGETIGSSFDILREAANGDTSWHSGESISTTPVEKYRGNGYQAQDENTLPISGASGARRDQELSSKNTSPGSWELSVSKNSLDFSLNPFETLPNSPTPSRQRSSSYRSFGSPSSGDLSPIYEGRKKNLFISAPKQTPERVIARSTSHPDELHQVPRDIPKRKSISDSPESPGGDVFHFSPQGDSYNPLITCNLIHIKGSPLNESASMQQKKQPDTILYKDSEIPASARDGFEGYGSPNFSALEVPPFSPPTPLTGLRGFVTNNHRQGWKPRYSQDYSAPESDSGCGQDLVWGAVPGGRRSIFGPGPRLPDSSTLPERYYGETVKDPNTSTGNALAKLYASMELPNYSSQEQGKSAVYPTSKQDLGLRPSLSGGNTAVSNGISLKASHHLQLKEPDHPGPQASPHALSLGKGKYCPSPDANRFNSLSNNKIVVGEFVPNFVDKTEKHAKLRRETERMVNEPDNPRIRGSPFVAGPSMGAKNPTLVASLSSAPSDALQEAFDFLSTQVKPLLQEKSGGRNIWSKHFPITNDGSIQYMPKDTKTYAFEDCSNLQKLTRCTAVFLDTLTGTSQSGFWADPGLFITSLRFREGSANGHVMDYNPNLAFENPRYFVSPSNTGMLEDRVPVILKAWDTPSNLAIFRPIRVGSYEHIGIENLVEDHEFLHAHSNQIHLNHNIAAVGYIRARPKPQEGTESDGLRCRTSYPVFNSDKDTRIRTVCSINQVRRFIEGSENTEGVLKADCLFPLNFYGSPCVIKQSGSVIGVVNGPHSVSNTRDIGLFPQGFRKWLRWFAL